jgi:sugar/nucleoside kinase (ribokinase family)
MSRLVLVGSVIVDIVMYVDELPPRAGDVIARGSLLAAGGGRNVLTAASRQGLPAVYAGRHGTGPFGELIRSELRSDGIAVQLAATPGSDSGYCVALVEPGGERTFATAMGVEARLCRGDLESLTLAGGDVVYLSGYDLAYPHGPDIAAWVSTLDRSVGLVFDPSPLVGQIEPALLEPVARRASWLSANAAEARVLGRLGEAAAGAVVRTGANGCVVRAPGAAPVEVTGYSVDAVDSSGAGDAHVGAFTAGLARGLSPVEAARWANAAAALAVTRHGPATCPDLAATAAFLGC